jgi:hypothetical protein
MNVTITQTNEKSDRYCLEDSPELKTKPYSPLFLTHNLCTNCPDYYDIPPCQTDFSGDSGCFPGLELLDHN